MKKTLLKLGSIVTTVIPIISIISCGDKLKTGEQETVAPKTDAEKVKKAKEFFYAESIEISTATAQKPGNEDFISEVKSKIKAKSDLKYKWITKIIHTISINTTRSKATIIFKSNTKMSSQEVFIQIK